MSNSPFMMKALGNIEIGSAKYAAGAVFDALNIQNLRDLQSIGAAEIVRDTSTQPEVVAAPSHVVETRAVAAPTGIVKQEKAQDASKGTTHVGSTKPAGR